MSVIEKAAAIPTESDQVQLVRDDETASAERIIQDHVLLAVASGLIPGPGIDLVAAFTVQMTMVKRIANLYDVPFRQDAAKSTMTALMGDSRRRWRRHDRRQFFQIRAGTWHSDRHGGNEH